VLCTLALELLLAVKVVQSSCSLAVETLVLEEMHLWLQVLRQLPVVQEVLLRWQVAQVLQV
jgi:hypothetical protein